MNHLKQEVSFLSVKKVMFSRKLEYTQVQRYQFTRLHPNMVIITLRATDTQHIISQFQTLPSQQMVHKTLPHCNHMLIEFSHYSLAEAQIFIWSSLQSEGKIWRLTFLSITSLKWLRDLLLIAFSERLIGNNREGKRGEEGRSREGRREGEGREGKRGKGGDERRGEMRGEEGRKTRQRCGVKKWPKRVRNKNVLPCKSSNTRREVNDKKD